MQPYSDYLLQYFHHTTHQGRLDVARPDVFSATVGTPDNQDTLQVFLQIQNDQVKNARFLAKGSVAIIAGAQWICDDVLNKRISDIATLTVPDILSRLQLPKTKVHIANLLLQAVKQCMDDYLNA